MLKKTITYDDYNGNPRKEDFYFNLSKAELMELELGTVGGFSEMMQRLIDAQDAPSIMREIKNIILSSYGEKSADGKRFIKSKELSDAFSQTEAYSQLFMDLVTDDKKAAEFVIGLVPSDIAKQIPEDVVSQTKSKLSVVDVMDDAASDGAGGE